MKKILLTALISFVTLPCMAFENYMVLTDHPISKVKVGNENIITVEPIETNACTRKEIEKYGEEKCFSKSMMIIPHCVGSTKLSFCKGKKRIRLTVRVYENETCIKRVNGVKLVPVDLPPELK